MNVSIRLWGRFCELSAIDRCNSNKPLKSSICAIISIPNILTTLLLLNSQKLSLKTYIEIHVSTQVWHLDTHFVVQMECSWKKTEYKRVYKPYHIYRYIFYKTKVYIFYNNFKSMGVFCFFNVSHMIWALHIWTTKLHY